MMIAAHVPSVPPPATAPASSQAPTAEEARARREEHEAEHRRAADRRRFGREPEGIEVWRSRRDQAEKVAHRVPTDQERMRTFLEDAGMGWFRRGEEAAARLIADSAGRRPSSTRGVRGDYGALQLLILACSPKVCLGLDAM